MFLTWHGSSCIRLFDKDVSIVMDPFDEKETGLQLPDLKVDIVTFSYPQDSFKESDSVKVFSWPGEFEAAGIPFSGVWSRHPKTGRETVIFTFTADNVNICHLGKLDHVPDSAAIDRIGKVDLLIAPAGGEDTVQSKDLQQIIEDLEPSVLVPVLYDIPGLKRPSGITITDFLKSIGMAEHQTVDKIDLKKTSFPAGRTETIVCTSSSAG